MNNGCLDAGTSIVLDERVTTQSGSSSKRKWLRLLYLLPLILLLPPVFTPTVNLLTNFLNWTDQVFG